MTAMTPSSQPVRHGAAVDTQSSPVAWDEESWRDQAACRSTEADLFFPLRRSRGAMEQIRAAKSVCWSCQVRETCLRYALETNQEAGIWGGTSEDERRKLRRAWLARSHAVSAWIT
jgi:WhiB family transcriptional regulator, redox-sensing transcriptional regulator